MKKNTTADSVFTFFLYNILGEVRPEKLYCACLWKYNNPDGTPAFEGLVNPKSDFDALRADGARPWVGASIRTIEDMTKAAILGAELITSNEPEFMISDYNVFVGGSSSFNMAPKPFNKY